MESAAKNVGGVAAADSDLPENELLLRQLVFSDRIFINKVDLLPQNAEERKIVIDKVRNAIDRVNTQAEV